MTMCGLWGFIGDEPQEKILDAIVRAASTRGPHAWGVAMDDGAGPCRHVSLTPLSDEVDEAVGLGLGRSCFIGHSRLATSSYRSRSQEEDVQPLLVRWTALAHNGTVRNAGDFELPLHTGNDSEALLQRIATSHGELGVRVLAAMQDLPPVPHALIVMERGALVAARRDGVLSPSLTAGRQGVVAAHPLFSWTTDHGTYLCSRRAWAHMEPVRGVTTYRVMEQMGA